MEDQEPQYPGTNEARGTGPVRGGGAAAPLSCEGERAAAHKSAAARIDPGTGELGASHGLDIAALGRPGGRGPGLKTGPGRGVLRPGPGTGPGRGRPSKAMCRVCRAGHAARLDSRPCPDPLLGPALPSSVSVRVRACLSACVRACVSVFRGLITFTS